MLNLVFFSVSVVAAVWLALSVLLAWENRRFSIVRLAKQHKVRRLEHLTTLYLPCKGDDGGLAENLDAFFTQRHPNYQLTLVVESTIDAAYPVIQAACARHSHISSRIVVAGVAETDGQKVHNLRVATENIEPDVRILAFADSDIRPDPHWLQSLTITVCKSKDAAANTGYRWMLPQRNSLINLLVYSINAMLAGSMGSGKHFLVWGGSWAIRRNNFDRLAIREAWKGTLSDDLVASRVIHELNENVRFGPRCLSCTDFDMSWSDALEFLRRQYLIGRKYAGKMFWSGYFVLAATVITWWTLLGLAIFQTGPIGSVAAIGALSVYLINVVKGLLRQSVFRHKDPGKYASHRLAAWFDIFASPPVMTFNFVMMTVALFGSRIKWRGNHYQIYPNGQIRLLDRSPIPSIRQNANSRNKTKELAA